MLVASLFAGRVAAQSEPIALDASACDGVDRDELRRILTLERRLLDTPDAMRVALRCDAQRAWLSAGDVTRELELESVPEGLRARLLALAIAELRPRPSPPPPRAERPQRFRLWLGAHVQRSSLTAVGAQLGLGVRLTPWLALASGSTFTQGTTSIDRGELRVRHASAHAGVALQRELGRFTLGVGAGVRGGWLGLRGLPGEAAVSSRRFDPWFVGPMAFANASVRLARYAFVVLALELTHTVREVRAEVRGGTSTTLSPWLGGASLGVGASW